MKRHRQWHNDIKYTPRSYDNLLPYDISELLIAHRCKIKMSDEVLADKIDLYLAIKSALRTQNIAK